MPYELAFFLPSIICFILGAYIIFTKSSEPCSKISLLLVTILIGIYFAIEAFYFIGITESSLFLQIDVLKSIIVPLIIPLSYRYLKSFRYKCRFGMKEGIIFLPPVILGIEVFILSFSLNNADSNSYMNLLLYNEQLDSSWLLTSYYAISVTAYNILLLIQGLFMLGYISTEIYKNKMELRKPECKEKELIRKVIHLLYLSIILLIYLYTPALSTDSFWFEHQSLTIALYLCWSIIYIIFFYIGIKPPTPTQHPSHK